MAIVTKEMLKSYFVNAKVPGYEEYVDFIDTMGDMNLSVYDANDDGRVEEADWAANTDTVDGQHASAFAPSGYGLGTYAQDISGQDLNGNFATGLYRGSACTNSPASSWYWYIIMSHSNTSWYVQIAVNYYDQRVWVRQKDNGVWTAWKNIYPAAWGDITGKPSTFTPSSHTHPGGDITSQVGDANTVDSLHASQFVRSDANDTKTGDLRMSGGLTVGSTNDYASGGEVTALLPYYRRPVSTKRLFPITWIPTITVYNGVTLNASSTYYLSISAYGVPDYAYAKAVLLRVSVGSTGTQNPYLLFYPDGTGYLRACVRAQSTTGYHNDGQFLCDIGTNYQIKMVTSSFGSVVTYIEIHGVVY